MKVPSFCVLSSESPPPVPPSLEVGPAGGFPPLFGGEVQAAPDARASARLARVDRLARAVFAVEAHDGAHYTRLYVHTFGTKIVYEYDACGNRVLQQSIKS